MMTLLPATLTADPFAGVCVVKGGKYVLRGVSLKIPTAINKGKLSESRRVRRIQRSTLISVGSESAWEFAGLFVRCRVDAAKKPLIVTERLVQNTQNQKESVEQRQKGSVDQVEKQSERPGPAVEQDRESPPGCLAAVGQVRCQGTSFTSNSLETRLRHKRTKTLLTKNLSGLKKKNPTLGKEKRIWTTEPQSEMRPERRKQDQAEFESQSWLHSGTGGPGRPKGEDRRACRKRLRSTGETGYPSSKNLRYHA